MGDVKVKLSQTQLPDREPHNSRLFVDLAENIHIHFREYRFVFSIDEFLEFANVIEDSRSDINNFLEQNPDYQEKKYPTTIIIAGGRDRQMKPLQNSISPNQSNYYNDHMAIELQEEYVTDEIHVHYRDFRLVFNLENFKIVAEQFTQAAKKLGDYEKRNEYTRQFHPDRFFEDCKNIDNSHQTKMMGAVNIKLNKVESFWFKDILREFKPSRLYVEHLIKRIKSNNFPPPIILSTESDKRHLIVDGHHRYYATAKAGMSSIEAVILDIPFENTEELRNVDVLLKKFDMKTNCQFGVSGYFKSYLCYKLNRFYSNKFHKLMCRQTLLWRIARKIRTKILGKKKMFFSFFEAYRGDLE